MNAPCLQCSETRKVLVYSSPDLIAALMALGDEYGRTGVVRVAQALVDGWELTDYCEAAVKALGQGVLDFAPGVVS